MMFFLISSGQFWASGLANQKDVSKKTKQKTEDTSPLDGLFWDGSFGMAVETVLALQLRQNPGSDDPSVERMRPVQARVWPTSSPNRKKPV